jgi:acetoin utilization deacetylase AcuC-like enzyme
MKKWHELKFYYTDHFEVPLPLGHRFPMEKYRLLKEKLLSENLLAQNQLHAALEATEEDILLAHSADYYFGLENGTLPEKELRPIGLTWSPQLFHRSRGAVGGFLEATISALQDGFSATLSGGTHHAHRDRGEGYCVFNDFAVSALKILKLGLVKKILIIDLDVHQGNGNSSILGSREDVFIMSLHGEKNYPFKKVASHLDVGLPEHTGDEAYLLALSSALTQVQNFNPDIIFYQAGVDVLKEDSLGTFDLSFEGIMKRDQMIFEFREAMECPLVMALGGGYSKPIEFTIKSHVNTYKVARGFYL